MITDKHFNLDSGAVNTSEAYSKNLYLVGKSVIIPYINILIMPENSLRLASQYVEFAYLCFHNVINLNLNGKETLEITFIDEKKILLKEVKEEWVSLQGVSTSNGAEVYVKHEYMSLFICKNSRTSNSNFEFIPFDTPKYKGKMKMEEVDYFFSPKFLPEALLENLGNNIHSLHLL